eukprot:Skav206011  [mRNA]  locus=scaffold1644:11796:12053:+ [translate_table: standard]
MAPLWKVVGGRQTGGLTVRCGASLSSAVEEQKLAPEALVREAQRGRTKLELERSPAISKWLSYVGKQAMIDKQTQANYNIEKYIF